MNKSQGKYYSFCIYLLLVLTTFLAFEQLRGYDFINFDDPVYVTCNPYVLAGLSQKSHVWAFTRSQSLNWHPLTWLSHMLDLELFGLNAGRHHLVNLLLHTLNAMLLLNILARMTGSFWRSVFVAAAFALHPMHVESVAWITERKDVLSTLFCLLTISAYLRYIRGQAKGWYLLTLLLFILGLMSKPMIVTLPFVLLLLDYWPLQRIRSGRRVPTTETKCDNADNLIQTRPLLHIVVEKVPFLLLSVIFSVITFLDHLDSGALGTVENLTAFGQFGNVLVSYATYIGKMIWPRRLAILYLHPADSLSVPAVILSGLLLVLISLCFLYIGRKYKYLTVGWLWYLGTLVPVIGLVQAGGQAMADRYSYMPFTGLFIIIAWGINDLLANMRHREFILAFLMILSLSALAITTRFQVRHWRSNKTVFKHAIEVTNNNYVAYCALGEPLLREGKPQEAAEYFTEALRAKPDYSEALNNLGYALAKQGKYQQAEGYYHKALKIEPDLIEAHNNLAQASFYQGKLDKAVQHWLEAARLEPNNAATHINLGVVLATQGKIEKAIKHLNQALKIEPDNKWAHMVLQQVLLQRDDTE
jgi:tetratricopeptide (TPR) repeat protein